MAASMAPDTVPRTSASDALTPRSASSLAFPAAALAPIIVAAATGFPPVASTVPRLSAMERAASPKKRPAPSVPSSASSCSRPLSSSIRYPRVSCFTALLGSLFHCMMVLRRSS